MTLAIHKNPSPPQVIALIERVQQALAAVEKPTEAAQLVKEADAIKYLAKKAECSTAVQNQAATVAILAKHRAGELLKALDERGELHHGGGDHRSRRASGAKNGSKVTLKELGVDKDDSSRWKAVSKVPRPKLQEHIDKVIKDGGEPTTSDAIRFANNPDPEHVRHRVNRAGATCAHCPIHCPYARYSKRKKGS